MEIHAKGSQEHAQHRKHDREPQYSTTMRARPVFSLTSKKKLAIETGSGSSLPAVGIYSAGALASLIWLLPNEGIATASTRKKDIEIGR